LYNSDLAIKDWYNTSDPFTVNYNGVPYGFTPVALPGRPAGYPLLLSVDLSEARVPEILQYIRDGQYLDHQRTQQLTVQVGDVDQGAAGTKHITMWPCGHSPLYYAGGAGAVAFKLGRVSYLSCSCPPAGGQISKHSSQQDLGDAVASDACAVMLSCCTGCHLQPQPPGLWAVDCCA
jgi:hypothetical protein